MPKADDHFHRQLEMDKVASAISSWGGDGEEGGGSGGGV